MTGCERGPSPLAARRSGPRLQAERHESYLGHEFRHSPPRTLAAPSDRSAAARSELTGKGRGDAAAGSSPAGHGLARPAAAGASVVATHIRIGPRVPDPEPVYDVPVVDAVASFLRDRADECPLLAPAFD